MKRTKTRKVFDKEKYLEYLRIHYSPSDYMIERELNEEFYEYCDQKDVEFLREVKGYDIKDEWCKIIKHRKKKNK